VVGCMSIDFGSLMIELEALSSSSKEDFSQEFWSEYENYLKKYNLLLKDLQTLGFFKKMSFIDPVPLSDQSFASGFSKYEKAKLREITNASNILFKKVRLMLIPPSSDIKVINKVRSNKIFLIHGKDEQMKLDVSRILEALNLEPVILREKLTKRQNIIENINDYDYVSFAVVLLSPDDLTSTDGKNSDNAKYLGNHNVIFELGYFLGRLGKQNVVALFRKKKGFKIPIDYSGVLWIEYKLGWYYELINQLKACNFDVDVNKISWL
jgi:predicted nucleotide-binding protein